MDRKRTALAAAVVLALGFGMAGTAWAADLTVGSGETRTVSTAKTVDSVKVSGDKAALHITSGGRVDVAGTSASQGVYVTNGSSENTAPAITVEGGELYARLLNIATPIDSSSNGTGQLEVGPGGIVKITSDQNNGQTNIGTSNRATGKLTVKSGGRFESDILDLFNGSFSSEPGSYVNLRHANFNTAGAALEGTTVIRTELNNKSDQTLISHLVLGSPTVTFTGDKPLANGSAIYLEGTAPFDTANPYPTLKAVYNAPDTPPTPPQGEEQSSEQRSNVPQYLQNTAIDVSHFNVAAEETSVSHLRPGDTGSMTLFKYTGGASGLNANSLRGPLVKDVPIGTTLHGSGVISLDQNEEKVVMNMTVADGLQPQTHNAVMAAAAGLSAVAGGADFISSAAATLAEEGFSTFAAAGGGEQRYDTGSHVTSHEWHGVVGVGAKNTSAAGSSTEYGLFYDYGNSRYSTYQSAGNGSGKAIYKGGGLFGKYTTPAGWYVEGSFRAGRVNNRADNLFHDGFGRGYDFKTDSPYYGFHAGLGKTIALGGADSLDVYGKYFYTHVGSDSFHAGGSYDIDSVESSLLRIGARWNHGVGDWTWYLGAAYEHEFDGEAKGTADGLPIRSADLGGSSARFELGTNYTTGKWILGASVEAYAGEHRGVSGHVSAGMRF